MDCMSRSVLLTASRRVVKYVAFFAASSDGKLSRYEVVPVTRSLASMASCPPPSTSLLATSLSVNVLSSADDARLNSRWDVSNSAFAPSSKCDLLANVVFAVRTASVCVLSVACSVAISVDSGSLTSKSVSALSVSPHSSILSPRSLYASLASL